MEDAASSQTWRTPVRAAVSAHPVSHRTPLVFIGSCFTDHIGRWLKELHFDAAVNPAGILYNPLSIARTLHLAADGAPCTEAGLKHAGGRWFSYDFHGDFSDEDPAACLRKINAALETLRQTLQRASHLFLTLGSAYVYREKASGRTVANCHRMPAAEFTSGMLTVPETIDALRDIVRTVRGLNPNIHIVFTVSPIRHYLDDLHRNAVSKATLLCAVEALTGGTVPAPEDAGIAYFPAFEIMMDDLRDYRFYADDLTHPGRLAADYIRQQFAAAYFSPETRQLTGELARLRQDVRHRPRRPGSEEHRAFTAATLKKIADLQKRYPFLDLGEESALLKSD